MVYHDEDDHHEDDVPEDVLREPDVGRPAGGIRAFTEWPSHEEARVPYVGDHVSEDRQTCDPLEDVCPPLEVLVEGVQPSDDASLVRGSFSAGIRILSGLPFIFQVASSPVSSYPPPLRQSFFYFSDDSGNPHLFIGGMKAAGYSIHWRPRRL
jgi:hypothetical protein